MKKHYTTAELMDMANQRYGLLWFTREAFEPIPDPANFKPTVWGYEDRLAVGVDEPQSDTVCCVWIERPPKDFYKKDLMALAEVLCDLARVKLKGE